MKNVLMSDLDELVANIEKTFKNEKWKFTKDDDLCVHCLTDVECDFKICELLIDFEQISNVNWPAVRYLKQRGYTVFAGEKDSFGWLTGVIAPMSITKEVLEIPENEEYIIIFG